MRRTISVLAVVVKGAYTEIERLDKMLCTPQTTRYPSWSLSWVSLEGPASTGENNIFQVGFAKCPAFSVCPYNGGALYYFSYYERATGVCGADFREWHVEDALVPNPGAAGYHFFQVSKVGTTYNLYIDETFIRSKSVHDVETCWGGVKSAEWQNETLNDNDQAGGRVANPQGFHKNQYQTSAGWQNANRTLGSKCNANSLPGIWHCNTSGTTANYFDAYDGRVP
ncbi:MAG: hypothetical protein H0U52_07270 [Chloroflexi bacterium]|nr:hypothetical protein [Chloroflexota bacterium]